VTAFRLGIDVMLQVEVVSYSYVSTNLQYFIPAQDGHWDCLHIKKEMTCIASTPSRRTLFSYLMLLPRFKLDADGPGRRTRWNLIQLDKPAPSNALDPGWQKMGGLEHAPDTSKEILCLRSLRWMKILVGDLVEGRAEIEHDLGHFGSL
jgi:hypothetical protein